MTASRIGELLVADGKVPVMALHRALGFQKTGGDRVRLGTILLNWDLLPEQDLLDMLARVHHCDAVGWDTLSAAPIDAVRLLPAAPAWRLGAIPYGIERSAVRVAMVNPSDVAAVDEIATHLGKRILPAVTTEVRLMQAHRKFHGRHIPQEFRAVVQRLERRSRSVATLGRGSDYLAADLVQLERAAAPPSFRRATAPRIAETPAEGRGLPPPPDFHAAELADMLEPAPPIPPVLAVPPPAEPVQRIPPEPVAPPAPAPPEESLAEWVADALGSARGEPARSSSSPPAPPVPEEERPVAASAAPGEDDQGMWQSSSVDEREDEGVSGMWTTDAAEVGSPAWEPRSRDEIAQAALDSLLPGLPRVLLLSCNKLDITGWDGRGEGLDAERVGNVRIAAHERSVFGHVERSAVPHFGPLDRELWPEACIELFGPAPPDCGVFPIRILDGVAGFVYADRLGEPMLYEDFGVIARAAAWTAGALSQYLRQRNNKTATVH